MVNLRLQLVIFHSRSANLIQFGGAVQRASIFREAYIHLIEKLPNKSGEYSKNQLSPFPGITIASALTHRASFILDR